MIDYKITFTPIGEDKPLIVNIQLVANGWQVSADGERLGLMVESSKSVNSFTSEDDSLKNYLGPLSIAFKAQLEIDILPQKLKEIYHSDLIAHAWGDNGMLKLIAGPTVEIIPFALEIERSAHSLLHFSQVLSFHISKEGSARFEEFTLNTID